MLSSTEKGLVIPVGEPTISALEGAQFLNLRPKAELWLRTHSPTANSDMDSVFLNDRQFELLVDTRGFNPQDVKCTVSPTSVEIVAERKEVVLNRQRSMATTRSYQLPKNVSPEQACCCMSTEGLLLLTVPWKN